MNELSNTPPHDESSSPSDCRALVPSLPWPIGEQDTNATDAPLVALARALAALLIPLLVSPLVARLDAILRRLDHPVTPPPLVDTPALLSINAARVYCGGVALSTWNDHNARGVIPSPVHMGGRVFWRRDDLDLWIAEGLPGRAKFEAIAARTQRR